MVRQGGPPSATESRSASAPHQMAALSSSSSSSSSSSPPTNALKARAVSNESSQSVSSPSRSNAGSTRRWPGPISTSSSSSSSNKIGTSSNAISSASNKTRSAKGTYFLSRGGKESASSKRPESGSTVDSFTSVDPYPTSDSRKTSLQEARSSTSSTNRTYYDPLTREKEFEEMLASGGTWRKSETADVAKSDSGRSSDSGSERNHSLNNTFEKRKGVQRENSARQAVVPEVTEEEEGDYIQRTPSLHSASSSLHIQKSPARPPKSAERSPSGTSQIMSTFPSSGSETITGLTVPTAVSPADLPIHPHYREADEGIKTPQSPESIRFKSSARSGPSLQVRSSPTTMTSRTSSNINEASRKISSNSQGGVSPAFSNSSQTTFTPFQSNSDPLTQDQSHLENQSNQGSNAALSEKSNSALKQRFKKTSGFLKRLGGGGDGGGSSTEKSRLTSPRSSRIVRRPSQSSIASEGGASIANSTKSAPGEYQPRWDSQKVVPVPSIPSRFKGTPSRFKGTKKVSSTRKVEANEGDTGETRLGNLSASDSIQSQQSILDNKVHGREAPSSASGSTGSATTELKHALKAWENEMDATLKQSGQDLEAKTKIEKPSPFWGPGPQLPEYRLNRKSSFMDEGNEDGDDKETVHLSSQDTAVCKQEKSPYDSQFLIPQQTLRTSSLGLSLPLSSSFQTSVIHSEPLTSTATFPSSPRRESSDDSTHLHQRSRDSNVSSTSARSFETAIDRPYFIRHAKREEPSIVEKNLPKAPSPSNGTSPDENHDTMDPEKSIRLVTYDSSEVDEGSSSILNGKISGLAVIQEVAGGHLKEKTLTQSDFPRRSPSPAVEQPRNGQTMEEAELEEGVDTLARESALRCWNEDETFKRKEKVAEWLGGTSILQRLARKYYMEQFDFKGLRIDAAFRKLCDKLFLRAETQQVDRILSIFSQRYFECNPQSLLVTVDVIHALVFSILLLNTDLHVADIQDRMTRNQFVRNTLAAIMESSEVVSAQTWTAGSSIRQEAVTSQSSLNVSVEDQPIGGASSSLTVSSRPAPSRRVSNDAVSTAGSDAAKTMADSIGRIPFSKAWEVEMEGLLKEIYAAVKTDQIRLPIVDSDNLPSLLHRKAPKVGGSDRVNALKRGSIRGIQGLLGSNATTVKSEENLTASRSSLNSTKRSFSDYNATQSTPSTSLGSTSLYGPPPTLGFANTLSKSIIKEAKDEEDSRSIGSINDDLTDDELALLGPPWAKEGTLTRKHYWEAPLKRAKDKNWTECFVVVQKGMFSMFKFGDNAAAAASNTNAPVAGVGGGNWLSNATCLGEFSLAHTLANSLPPPGYNRARPHVFALTLPSGSVYFFQTGHEELVQEWVSACNYWAARQSREPLAGGVSNMEYGWNRVMPCNLHDDDDATTSSSHTDFLGQSRPSLNTGSDTRSIRSGKSGKSLRMRVGNNGMFQSWQSGADRIGGGGGSSPLPSLRASLTFQSPDRLIFVNEWRAPAPPTVSSTLTEEDQLEACKRHKVRVELELTEHNSLRQPMIDYLTSTPGISTTTINKAIANFDRKASYLLSDLTKFTLYTATLASANKLKAEKGDARKLNRMMLKADEELSRVKEGPPVVS